MNIEAVTITGKYSGPSVLITAGMDGDEYTGIETARTLINTYKPDNVRGTLTILPTVNVAGFQNHTSFSPVDRKYPKFTFPGTRNGSDTEVRMHYLYETYVKHAGLWIDLHGGATDERLTPFLWLSQSKKKHIRNFQTKLLSYTSAPVVVWDRHPFMPYSVFLERLDIPYIMVECGDQGKTDKKDVKKMARWVHEALMIFGSLVHTSKMERNDALIYTSVQYTLAPDNGIWQSSTMSDIFLGKLFSSTLHKERAIKRQSGLLLWQKIGTECKKGDVLAAYARELISKER